MNGTPQRGNATEGVRYSAGWEQGGNATEGVRYSAGGWPERHEARSLPPHDRSIIIDRPPQALFEIDRRVVAERLVNVRYHLHDLAEQGALAVVDNFGDEIGADRLTVGVEFDLPIGRIDFK